MPRIFDNIDQTLLPALRDTLKTSYRADFCVGYFNLGGWKDIDDLIENYIGGENACCRLLVGMNTLPDDELKQAFLEEIDGPEKIDNDQIRNYKKQIVEQFKKQLLIGTPSNEIEAGLIRLREQLKTQKLIVKLFVKERLHAKLYLIHDQTNPNLPTVGFLGSSNLTFSGLKRQGELNIDVLDHDACNKLAQWFNERWKGFGSVDISQELVGVINESWARSDLRPRHYNGAKSELIPPYYIYLKMAYHLSQEALIGEGEFEIPRNFSHLFEFQKAAVKLAARHLTKRGGVLIGDVVGLGKTLIASALAKIFQEDFGYDTLILCPKNLVEMWENYITNYRLFAKVIPFSQAPKELNQLDRRYRLVLIDESHNLRNADGKRYKAIAEYITNNDSKCILLSATPYNKSYQDLSAQLMLFVSPDQDLGIRPESLLNELGGWENGESNFNLKHQCLVSSIKAFEKSNHADDWRELMKLFFVRRTRSFIKNNYAATDENNRQYLVFPDGKRAYFPDRIPRTIKVPEPSNNLSYQDIADIINSLNIPRYGLGKYIIEAKRKTANSAEKSQLQFLSKAGKRLKGFSRTNLFKRLESSESAFLQSLERHLLRNFIYAHAIDNDLDIPIGPQSAELLDTRFNDGDEESSENDEIGAEISLEYGAKNKRDFRQLAAQLYKQYQGKDKSRFKWIRPSLFDVKTLSEELEEDIDNLLNILANYREWESKKDAKLAALTELLTIKHPTEKVLIFSQFADTVDYLVKELKAENIKNVEGITGKSANPNSMAKRFSPESNKDIAIDDRDQEPIRVLIATDILSEGHNLQDCAIIVNYDLPWAIIRLIQRAGRVDRIGQQNQQILCYSCLPAQGIETVINLRGRLRSRLQENADVVGTDEAFFEDEISDTILRDLYNEKAGILDGDDDSEVDLTSEAFQIWKNATDQNPELKKTIENLSNVVYATRAYNVTENQPEGVLIYMKTSMGIDSLMWVDRQGNSVTQSQLTILKAAHCLPDTPALPRHETHHELVKKGLTLIAKDERTRGGNLGRKSGVKYQIYHRLKDSKNVPNNGIELKRALDELYHYPLKQVAINTLKRKSNKDISDEELAQIVITLKNQDNWCIITEETKRQAPQIICSMGLVNSIGK